MTSARLGFLATLRGHHAEAERQYRQAVAMWDALGGTDPRRYFASWGLGFLLHQDRRYAEAVVELRKLVAPFEGEDIVPAYVAEGRQALGTCSTTSGDSARQKPCCAARSPGRCGISADDRDTLETRRTLGAVLRDQGKLDDAERLYREVLERHRLKYGPEHVRTKTTGMVLGILLDRRGRFAEAEPLLRGAVEVNAAVNGADSAYAAQAMQNLANNRLASGDLREAESLLRKTLAIQRVVYSGRNPDEGDHLNRLAYILLLRGDPAGPETYHQALAFHQARPLGEALWVTDGLHYLAWSMRRMGISPPPRRSTGGRSSSHPDDLARGPSVPRRHAGRVGRDAGRPRAPGRRQLRCSRRAPPAGSGACRASRAGGRQRTRGPRARPRGARRC